MALDGCGKLSKWGLYFFNTVMLLEGIAMLCLGLWLRFSSSTRPFFEMTALNTSAFVIGVTVLITLGSVLLGVAVIGAFTATKEHRWGLGLVGLVLALLALSVVVSGGLAYLKRDEVEAQLLEFYTTVYAFYTAEKDTPAIAVTLALFHNAFHCCGMLGGYLLEPDKIKKLCPKPSGILDIVPACPTVIVHAIESKAPVILGVVLGTGAVLLAALLCTIMLIRNIKKGLLFSPW